ncbi:hypothetical protein Bca101_094737 [Brassica carinata]
MFAKYSQKLETVGFVLLKSVKFCRITKGGSVFLFDRKVLRYLRKDGHNWRKKRDGKTVKEAHERLKAGSVDVLQCYYAHGHDNENFQRRSYWMLQEELSHIVFVHYLEVKGSRVSTSYNRMQRTAEDSALSSHEVFTSERDGYASGSINQYDHNNHSQATDSASVSGAHTPELEDAESAYNQQGSSIVYSHQQPPSTGFDPLYQMSLTPARTINGPGVRNKKSIDSQTWEEILGNCGPEAEGLLPLQPNKEKEAETGEWSCMFGQTEVPADVIADGILQCVAPMSEAGRVPFYVTCSNRLACSEVREFEYKVLESQAFGRETDESTESLEARFVKLLCSKSDSPSSSASSDLSQVSEKISLLLFENDDQLDQMLMNEISQESMKEKLLQEALKESLHSWLLQKIAEGGRGPNVLDEGGQGILHFAAALGYNWALEPTVVAGVSVDFRDVNGWTALHWAAFFGRELVAGSLIALGASPGTLTDPNPDFPSGSTPSDLAYANGYKGIAGYLSEYALRAHVSLLSLNESNTETSESAPSPSSSSLTDSLTAVRNATQAAARIHQVFRAQSFQKKQMKEFGVSEERALSMLAPKTHKQGRAHSDDSVQAAAIRIQNKFRGYKGRKDYLITRQRIIRIQAHVRGYQVRKNYRKIIWSVGILEKVILRWRRKGAGLRGFKSDALVDKMQDGTEREEDDDFFKQGRKQTEERLQKALARVKSMAQYPEARDQYRRLVNVVNDIQESKVEKALESSEEATCFDNDLIDIEALLGDDDTLMLPMSSTLWNT